MAERDVNAIMQSNMASSGNKIDLQAAQWTGLLNGDTGKAIYGWNTCPDKTVQVSGTVNGNITIQGSADGTNWVTLHDIAGNDLVFSGAGIKVILENPLYIRPSVAVGTGSNATVTITGSK